MHESYGAMRARQGRMSIEMHPSPRVKNKLLIRCPFKLNSFIHQLPTRRWDKARSAWVVVLSARNCSALDVMISENRNQIIVSEDALVRIRDKTKDTPRPEFKPFPFERYTHLMPYKPMKAQVDGLNHIWGLPHGAILHEMGLGKSKVAIDYTCAKFMEGEIDECVVYAPATLLSNWVGQWGEHGWVDYHVQMAGDKKTLGEWEEGKLKVLLVGIESMSTKSKAKAQYHDFLLESSGKQVQFIDESHNIKNPKSARAKDIIELGFKAIARFVMTGTFILQDETDMFAQFLFLNEDIIGFPDEVSFKARYIIYGGYQNREVIGKKNTEELINVMKPWCTVARKADYLDLPEKVYYERDINMTPEQKAHMGFLRSLQVDVNSNNLQEAVKSILHKVIQIQQCASGFRVEIEELGREAIEMGVKPKRTEIPLIPHSRNPKFREMVNIIGSCRGDEKHLIWCPHRYLVHGAVEVLSEEFDEESVAVYMGQMTRAEKDENKEKFLNDPSCRFFVATQASGGTGLTLNVATNVIYLGNTYKLMDRLQSEDRNHRIGQTGTVTYTDIHAKGSWDRRIADAIANKQDLADYLIEQMKGGQISRLREDWGI